MRKYIWAAFPSVWAFVLMSAAVLSVAAAPVDEMTAKARVFWDRYVAMERSFDPAIADMYADDAVIKNYRRYPNGQVREMILGAPEYKDMIRGTMGLAKLRGDASRYSNFSYKAEGERVRIVCSRFSELKKYDSSYELLVGPGPDGTWLIFEEISESRP
ncbi:MAG: hypothetical protein Q8Q08_03300 [Candidatus Omnitrophota bacterium]|nr:hypothetical protein [Candidatus Omnitrophota bacterium]MDZ4243187.1 hypothetical protein [Candidatus Omnitrophota bacterium]